MYLVSVQFLDFRQKMVKKLRFDPKKPPGRRILSIFSIICLRTTFGGILATQDRLCLGFALGEQLFRNYGYRNFHLVLNCEMVQPATFCPWTY